VHFYHPFGAELRRWAIVLPAARVRDPVVM
jgi:hypothetical protein